MPHSRPIGDLRGRWEMVDSVIFGPHASVRDPGH